MHTVLPLFNCIFKKICCFLNSVYLLRSDKNSNIIVLYYIVGGSIVGGSIVGGSIVGGSIVGVSIVGGSIVGGSIVGGSIVGGSIVGGSIVAHPFSNLTGSCIIYNCNET